jgi:hypothetical protein
MKNMMKDAVKWVLRSSRINVDIPASGFGFEVRRSMFIPMLDSKVRRLLYFGRMFDLIKNVEGDVVECGVLYGESLLLLSFLANDEAKKRKVWGFDSFEPLPPGTARDKTDTPRKLRHLSGTKAGTESVEKLLKDSGLGAEFIASQVTLVRGYFEDTLGKFTGKAIALLHIDVDLYDSYKRVLEELYPRVAPGGVIMFDEYMGTREHAYFPGAQRAIDEFLGERRSTIQRDSSTGKYYFVNDRKLAT